MSVGDDTAWPHDEELHAWWVEPGRLLAGEYPGSLDPDEARFKLELLIGAGIDSIVDLTTTGELRPYQSLLRAVAGEAGRGVRHFAHPIPDMGVADDASYGAILAVISEELNAGHTVYVHCWGGMGRTTTVIGCRLADTGLDYESVIERIADLRTGTRKAGVRCPQTDAQRAVIQRRCDHVQQRNR